MKRIALLSSILLLSAVWAVAQSQSDSSSTASQSSSQSTMHSGKTSVEGCLAGTDGNYTLMDKSGTTYQLTGDTSKLQAHVGHTIQVTGTSTPSTDATGQPSSSMSGSAQAQPSLSVTSFKHVSGTCTMMH